MAPREDCSRHKTAFFCSRTVSSNAVILPLPYDLETKEVLKQLAHSHRKLAELKGVAQTIPSERILISTLTLQEVKDT